MTIPPAAAMLWMMPEPLRRVRADGDDGRAGIDAAVLVGDQLGGRLGADDVGDVLEREAQIGLLRVVHSKQQYGWSRHRPSSLKV